MSANNIEVARSAELIRRELMTYGLIESNLVDQARSNQAVIATLCDFLVKLLQVTPATDKDPGPATDKDPVLRTFKGRMLAKTKRVKAKRWWLMEVSIDPLTPERRSYYRRW